MHLTKIATLSLLTLTAACAIDPGEESTTSVVEIATENGAEAHVVDDLTGETLASVMWEGDDLVYIDVEGHELDLEDAMIRGGNLCWDVCSIYLDGSVPGGGLKEHRACIWRCNGLF